MFLTFKYHTDPIKTGSIEKSSIICECCQTASDYVYTGPVFAESELTDCLCPLCIARGTAHLQYDASFTDYASIGNHGQWSNVSDKIKEEVAFRTPGFSGYKQEKWWTHCNDAATFLGIVNKNEILNYSDDFINELLQEANCNTSDWLFYLKYIAKDDFPIAYLFKCLHCGKIGGYADCLP